MEEEWKTYVRVQVVRAKWIEGQFLAGVYVLGDGVVASKDQFEAEAVEYPTREAGSYVKDLMGQIKEDASRMIKLKAEWEL